MRANLEYTLAMENEIMGAILNRRHRSGRCGGGGLKANPAPLAAWLDGVTTKDGGDAMAAVKASFGL